MKSRLRSVIFLAIVILVCWGCGYFQTTTSPSGIPPREPGPVVPIAISIADIISETNNQRRANGMSPLAENLKLNAAADYKMRDMFARQYFDHYAPDQTSGVKELLERFDYRYLVAGENLARGDFKDASQLVTAWMTSPGHRANILDSAYREIGIATGYDVFQGRRMIIAVQIFGTRG